MQDLRTYRVADYASDHNLVIAKALLKLNRTGRRAVQVRRYETDYARNQETISVGIKEQVQLLIVGRLTKTMKTDTRTRAK